MAEPTPSGIPSLDEFLTEAKPLNPDASTAELVDAYHQHFGLTPTAAKPSASLPTFDEFKKEAKPLNPGATTSELKQAWQDEFGVMGAREKKPTFAEAFGRGAKQGWLGVKESYEGTKERLLDPNDPLKKFTKDAGDALAQEAAKLGVPEDLQSKSFWERVRDPEWMGSFLGNTFVQSAPSAAGAAVGGAVAGPPGAIMGMLGTTFFQEAGQSYREAYEKYIKAGFSEEKAHENAFQASGISGAISGLVNSMAVPASLMSPAKSLVKNLFMRYVANVAVDTGDQVTGNIIAKATHDPARQVESGVPEAALGSALMGGPETMAAVQSGVKLQRSQPDQGLKPDTAMPGGGKGPAPGEPIEGLRNEPLKHADPVLKTKTVDDAIEVAKKVTDDIPIDLEALKKEVGEEVTVEKAEAEKVTETLKRQAEVEKYTNDIRQMFAEDKRIPAFEKKTVRAVDPDTLPSHEESNNRVVSRDQYEALSKILALEGKKLVVFEGEGRTKTHPNGDVQFIEPKLPGGFINRAYDQNTIFMNKRLYGYEPANVAFHELQHLLQRSEIFKPFRETVMEELAPGARRLAESRHTKIGGRSDLVFEEILSDIHGDAMMRPAFHKKLIQKIELQEGPEVAQTKLTTFIAELKGMIERVYSLIRGRTALSPAGINYAEKYVKNLERVHDALATALAEHYRKQGLLGVLPTTEKKSPLGTKPAERVVIDPEIGKVFDEKKQYHYSSIHNRATGVQEAAGRGVLGSAIQHLSDASHAMVSGAREGASNQPVIREKVEQAHRLLSSAYGFEKEYRENLEHHAKTKGTDKRLLEQAIDTALADYAIAHKNAKVYNRPQWLAREAAIAIGEKRFKDAAEHLKELKAIVDSDSYTKEAFDYQKEKDGALREYLHDTDAEMIIDKKGSKQKYRLKDGREVTQEDLAKDRRKPRPTKITKREDVEKEKKSSEKAIAKSDKKEVVPSEKDEGQRKEVLDKPSEPDTKPAPRRTSEEVQKEIDQVEEEMEKRGEQITSLYDPTDPEAKILEGYKDWKPMPERLAKLYRERNEIDAQDKKQFTEAVVRESKLPREEALGALKTLYLTTDSLVGHFNDTLQRWTIETTLNLGKLYNYFLQRKYGEQNMGEDFDDKFATFRWGGTAEKPVLTASTRDGRGLEQDVLNKVGAIWNAVARNAGKPEHNFDLKSGQLQIGTSAEEQSSFAPGVDPTYRVSEPTSIDKYIRLLQDKGIDLKRLVEAIQKSGQRVPDELNPVFREEMFHKRAEQRSTDFTNNELKPLIKAMRDAGVTLEQLDQYAHARHVINDNLNERLQQMNPDLAGTPEFEKLAGITDAEARAILERSDRAVMEDLMRRVDAMVEKTRDMMVEYGLESQQRIDGWREQYRSYVPLHREGFEDLGHPTGTGLSVRGTTAKDRLGSALKVVDVIANIAQARDQVISRGEKMRPVVALAGLLLKFPNKDIAKLDKYAPVTTIDPTTGLEVTIPGDLADYKRPMIRRRDPRTGEVKSFPDPTYKGRDNVVNFRIDGKDYAIIFNEQNARAMEIAKGLKNLDTPKLTGILRAVAPYTRYLASINTQYNPIFGIVNFVRDAQFAMLTLKSTELDGKQAKIAAGALEALKGIYQDARAIRRGETATSSTAQLWERFEHVGGPTGYRDLFFTSTERAEELKRLLSRDGWKTIKHPSKWGKAIENTALMQWLSDYNLAMENAIRLSVFKAGVESGLSDIKAASLAKNITVNFNKKGQIGAQVGALYAFFNANVQGTARIFETLFEQAENKVGFRLTSVGKQIIVGGILVGALQTFALALAGFDEDEPPAFIKNRNLVIPAPGTDKGYLAIPMPLGFNLLPTVGRLAAETVHAGLSGRSPKIMDKGATLMEAMLDTFNPLGSSSSLIQAGSPTVTDPIVALSENKDWTGKPISHPDYSPLRPTPGHSRAKDTATIWAIGLSKMINWATGGTDYVPGKLSPTPDAIDYLIGQATGGVGREVSKAAQGIRSTITGEELPVYKIPGVGRFAGTAGGSTGTRDRFYDNIREINAAALEIEGRMKNREEFSDFLKEHPEGRLKSTALRFQKQLGDLREQKNQLLQSGAPKSEIEKKEQQITNLMKFFNDQVERAKKG